MNGQPDTQNSLWPIRSVEDLQDAVEAVDFDGETYDRGRDKMRLSGQMFRVYTVMCDGRWRTLNQISQATGDPEASISARLRDLRKPKFGGFNVERKHVDRGLFAYKLEEQPDENS